MKQNIHLKIENSLKNEKKNMLAQVLLRIEFLVIFYVSEINFFV